MKRYLLILIKHPWLTAIFINLIVLILAETALLQRKYGVFTAGGFLQPFSVSEPYDIARFFVMTTWLDGVCLTLIAAFFALFCRNSSPRRKILFAYNYLAIMLVLILGILLTKFKVLSYFSDTLNFTVATNLAGGSLLNALRYIADEAMLMVAVLATAVIIYTVVLYIINRYISQIELPVATSINLRSYLFLGGGSILLTLFFISQLYANDNLRYGASQKMSYQLLVTLVNQLSDLDRDGAGYFSYPRDNAPFDASIYPNALDVPGNGIDENGWFGDFKYQPASITHQSLKEPRFAPGESYDQIVVIVLESGRADLINKQLAGKPVTPNISAIARDGSMFGHTYSHTGFTVSSLIALFNGSLIPQRQPQSLFDVFNRNGYNIAIFSGQTELFGGISDATNMKKNANVFFDATSAIEDRVYANTDPGSLRLSEERVVTEFKKTLTPAQLKQRNLVYINLQAAHFPYDHPQMQRTVSKEPIPRREISLENRAWLEETYWNAISSADMAIGEIVSHLKDNGAYERTLLIITSDHGESLFDDGLLGHGHKINDIQTRIPLIINRSNFGVDEPIGQQDIKSIILCLSHFNCDLSNEVTAINNKQQGVFQYIGALESPSQIAWVDRKAQRIILDLRQRTLFSDHDNTWLPLEERTRDSNMRTKIQSLLNTWEQLRWEQHLQTISRE